MARSFGVARLKFWEQDEPFLLNSPITYQGVTYVESMVDGSLNWTRLMSGVGHGSVAFYTPGTYWQGLALSLIHISSYGVEVPIANATIKPMLDGYANAQAAAVARGVNGQGRFGEKPVAADEMLVAIGADAAEWVGKWIPGIVALLLPTPGAIEEPAVQRVVVHTFAY